MEAKRAALPAEPHCCSCFAPQVRPRRPRRKPTQTRASRFPRTCGRLESLQASRALSGTDAELKSEAERFVEGLDLDPASESFKLQDAALPVDDAVIHLRRRVAELETQVRTHALWPGGSSVRRNACSPSGRVNSLAASI